jgi:3-oxoacyl-[acyl-carrier protein] reductase
MKILITGASTGIGSAIAKNLAENNELFLVYNQSKESAIQVAEEVTKMGGIAHLIQCDITKEENCVALINEVKELTDYLDVLVNNAGGLVKRVPATELTWDHMQEVFNLNTFSLFKITSLAIELLNKGTNPNIVNIASVVIRHGAPGATMYAASKGAVDVFTRGLMRELAPNIRVNTISPGVIDTPFHHKVSTKEQMDIWAEANPLKKNGQGEHIALAVSFCIENTFLNGENIDVNGGTYIR